MGAVNQMFNAWIWGKYDERKLGAFEALYHVPVVKDYMDYLLDLRADQEYMDRYGLSYSDIHDPRKLREVGSGSRTLGSATTMLSRNFDKLYR